MDQTKTTKDLEKLGTTLKSVKTESEIISNIITDRKTDQRSTQDWKSPKFSPLYRQVINIYFNICRSGVSSIKSR